jgi:glycogen debranching enzyme
MIKVVHFFDNNTTIEKKTNEHIGFLMTNKIGGYCYFSEKPETRYQGFFIENGWKLFKILDEIKTDGEIQEICNNFWNIERKKNGFREAFFMPDNYCSLVYEIDEHKEIELVFDVKESYDNRVWGRYYSIEQVGDSILVTFTKKTDQKEDKSHDALEYKMFIVIKSDLLEYSIKGSWIKQEYVLDKERDSQPFERHVFNALKLKAKKIVISASLNKEEAFNEAHFVFENLEKLKIKENLELRNRIIIHKQNISQKVAYICTQYALNNLVNKVDSTKGIFAGLPWFFQFWSRDELISLHALIIMRQYGLVKDILMRYIDSINELGRLPNIINIHGSQTGSTDSIGWLFKRVHDFLEALRAENLIEKYFSAQEIEHIKSQLAYALDRINTHFIKENLYYCDAQETWMDTNFDNDTRDGFRIETQVMYANMHSVMYYLTQDFSFKHKEQELRERIKQKFWNNKILADGLNDFTIRPNLFIAAYIYPELLNADEWKTCFKNALQSLWLSWGGLTTIDKKHRLFCQDYSGEQAKSYHRGDSWFWINNLAALVMYRTDKASFKKYVNKITEASCDEILFKGIIGSHAELSSAKMLKSQACLSQAWSNAMFIELMDEISK